MESSLSNDPGIRADQYAHQRSLDRPRPPPAIRYKEPRKGLFQTIFEYQVDTQKLLIVMGSAGWFLAGIAFAAYLFK